MLFVLRVSGIACFHLPQQAQVNDKQTQHKTDPDEPIAYQIRLKGHLGHEWYGWFDGLVITLEDSGETLLTGSVSD